MALTSTTLAGAMTATDIVANLTSATGVSAPNFQSGLGVTYLFCEEEIMQVYNLNGTIAGVLRGQLGTAAVAHAVGTPITAGLNTDFQNFQPAQRAFQTSQPNRFEGFSAPVVAANTIAATGPYFHVTGATLIKTITPLAAWVGGQQMTIVFDTAGANWDATGNISVAGTLAAALNAATFVWDAATQKWYPNRVA